MEIPQNLESRHLVLRASGRSTRLLITVVVLLAALTAAGPKKADAAPGRSTTIALTSDETRVVVVNHDTNSLSIIQVRNKHGNDVSNKIAEIPVGEEPRCVAVRPDDRFAFVTNAISATVSVVNLARNTVVKEIKVGTEPRGCALTANGSLLYVANHTEGTVSIIDTASLAVVGTVPVGGRPLAVAITDKGTGKGIGSISDDTVFVTKITLKPLADSGFTANRTSPNNFCNMTGTEQSLIFCPRPDLPADDPANTMNPQGVYPNQLLSALIRGNRLYLPNIGPQPEPPVVPTLNVQALIYNVDVNALSEVPAEHVNLNNQIKVETAQPPPSLDRTFGNDIVAIDGNSAGDTFLIVSRGGNQVFRAIRDASGQLDILNAAGTRVDCRLQTGNLPNGVAMRKDGTRGYANNEANFSVTSMDPSNCLTLQLDIASSEPPAPGSFQHAVLVGKLAFFTAFGIPDNDIFGTPIRDFIPRNFKGKQSKDGWSTCASCHNEGLSDGVTWMFGAGPRRTKPEDGMFSKQNPDDQDLLNWSGTRDSNTDFNNNSRGVEGGCGFASDNFDPGQCFAKGNTALANPAIYDHGIIQGGSDALDAMTLFIFAAVR